MPLSTLGLVDDNDTLDEYDNKDNKVSNGRYVHFNLNKGINYLELEELTTMRSVVKLFLYIRIPVPGR